jgi:hypothetical protein
MMNTTEQASPAAVAGQVDRPVRPQRWTGANIHATAGGGFVAIGDYLALERAAAMLAVDLAEARAASKALVKAEERTAELLEALRHVLEFQSAPQGPTIHNWGRWRRIADGSGA